jgi:cytochrome P450
MHFGMGGRQCIGKTVAQTNIYKLMSTLLREFDFQLVAADNKEINAEKAKQRNDASQLPELVSVSVSDLQHPLLVRAQRRFVS